MEGRWTIAKASDWERWEVSGLDTAGEEVPVVPCDDAAIERAAEEVERLMTDKSVWNVREAAERVLLAAGKVVGQ